MNREGESFQKSFLTRENTPSSGSAEARLPASAVAVAVASPSAVAMLLMDCQFCRDAVVKIADVALSVSPVISFAGEFPSPPEDLFGLVL